MSRLFTWKKLLLLLVPVLPGCSSYNKSMHDYYAYVREHNYDKAARKLEHNKFMNRSRNRLLYCLEAGRLYNLKKDYVTSNLWFNNADQLIESSRKDAAGIAVGYLVNPMQQPYESEDFERFMIHYYKALNYVALGEIDEAVVEARRITLLSNRQADRYKGSGSRYRNDPFALSLQGMIYEMAGDMNNAFIAYRNAADIYLSSNESFYGVKIPQQLSKDLLRTSAAMGFTDETLRYEKLLKTKFTESQPQNELILFLEEGQVPVKEERNFVFTKGTNGSNLTLVNGDGYLSNFQFDHRHYNIPESRLTALRTIRVAMPVYKTEYVNRAVTTLSVNGRSFTPELAQDLNGVAVNVLKERFLTELSHAVARQLSKKLVEKGAAAAAEGIAKTNDKKDKHDDPAEAKKEKKKNEQNAKAAGEAAGFVVNMINTATEKADTRNWQSLPSYISYLRIPLSEGNNVINITCNGQTKALNVSGDKRLQMLSLRID